MGAFERYYPQVSKQVFLSEINSNYAAAANYYAQRQKMFQKVLKEQANLTLGNFESQINDKIESLWQNNVYKVLENIYFDSSKNVDQKIAEVKTIFSTSEFLPQYIEAIKKSNYNLFKGKMGITFEQFIQNEIFNPYIKMASAFAGGHLDSLVSGALTSLASTVKGVKNIRPDLLISVSTSFEKEDSVLYGKGKSQKLPLELQRELKINWENAFPSFDNELETSDADVINKFLLNEDFFGFSAKVYNSNEDNKHFSQSKTIQTAINQVFLYPYTSNSGYVKRHSWEMDYAEVYVIWNLSKILRTIISPTTIAMIYGDKMMWMSNFLQSKVFYMNISYQNQIKDRYAGDNRIFPYINSPGILTKNYNIAKGINALNASVVSKKNSFNKKAYQGIEISLS